MTARPDTVELLGCVSRWLAEERSATFERRVARNVLDIVARELSLGPATTARKVARLEAITRTRGGLADLEATLCAMIEDGRIAPIDPAMLRHLHLSALDDLAIDQPHYAHELAAT